MTPDEINSFITGHQWRFAKTMAHMPHSYVVKAKCRSAPEFERFVLHIRARGYKQRVRESDLHLSGLAGRRGGPPVLDDGRAAQHHHHYQPGSQEMIQRIGPHRVTNISIEHTLGN
jgi:hypothetical protein